MMQKKAMRNVVRPYVFFAKANEKYFDIQPLKDCTPFEKPSLTWPYADCDPPVVRWSSDKCHTPVTSRATRTAPVTINSATMGARFLKSIQENDADSPIRSCCMTRSVNR